MPAMRARSTRPATATTMRVRIGFWLKAPSTTGRPAVETGRHRPAGSSAHVRLARDLERQPLGRATQGGVSGADLDPRDGLATERYVDHLGRDQEAQRLVGVLGRDPQPGRCVAPVADLERVPPAPAAGRGDRGELGLESRDRADVEVPLGDRTAAALDLRPHPHAERQASPRGARPARRARRR